MMDSPMPPRARSDAPPAAKARRVLIVDDHVDSADVMAQALEAHGHETRVAYDPFVAGTVAAEFQPELAILEINLPGMDGYALGAALRAELGECRIVALTGDATALNGLRSQWAGFDGYLTKPVSLDQLLSVVSGDPSAKSSWPSGTFLRSAKHPGPVRGPSYRPPRERVWIDLNESPEVVRYWTTELRCTEAQLRAAVAEVGVSADEVRKRLAK